METANTVMLHATRSERVLSEFSCTSNVQDIDNLSREGVGDCDEEEALSDDSLRLRLSGDDESDPDDTRAPGLICNQHTNSKSDTIDSIPDESEALTSDGRTHETKSTNHDRILIENDIATEEELRPMSWKSTSETECSKEEEEGEDEEEEEQYSGNVTIDDKTMSERPSNGLRKKDISRNGDRQRGSSVEYETPSTRSYENQRSSYNRSYYNGRPLRFRHNYPTDDQYYYNKKHSIDESNTYKDRYYNNSIYYGRGRNMGRGGNSLCSDSYARDNHSCLEAQYKSRHFSSYKELTNARTNKSTLSKMGPSANGFTKDYSSYEQVDPTNAVRNEEIQIGDCTSQSNTEIATEVKKEIDDDGDEETPPGCKLSAAVMEEEEGKKKKDDDSTSASVRDESPEEDWKEEELRDSSDVGNEEEPVKSGQLEEMDELCVVTSNGALQPFNNVDASSRLDEKEEKSSPDPSPLRNDSELAEDLEDESRVEDRDSGNLGETSRRKEDKTELEKTDQVEEVVSHGSRCEKSDNVLQVESQAGSPRNISEEKKSPEETSSTIQEENAISENIENTEEQEPEDLSMKVVCEESIDNDESLVSADRICASNVESCGISEEQTQAGSEEQIVAAENTSKESQLGTVGSQDAEPSCSEQRRETLENYTTSETNENDLSMDSPFVISAICTESDQIIEDQSKLSEDKEREEAKDAKDPNTDDVVGRHAKDIACDVEDTIQVDFQNEPSSAAGEVNPCEESSNSAFESSVREPAQNEKVALQENDEKSGLANECNLNISEDEVDSSGATSDKHRLRDYDIITLEEEKDLETKNVSADRERVIKIAGTIKESRELNLSEKTVGSFHGISNTAPSSSTDEDSNNNANSVSTNDPVTIIDNERMEDSSSDKERDKASVGTEKRKRGSKQSILSSEGTILGSLLVQSDEEENGSARLKRKTAKDAEEIIRNKFSHSDSDFDSSDGSEMVVTVNDLANVEKRTASITTSTTTAASSTITSTTTGSTANASPPNTLKRKFIDIDLVDDDGNAKALKTSFECEKDLGNGESSRNSREAYKELAFVRKFFQRDPKQKLVKLKQEELEELLIQKIVEAIAMRGEIGKLREQARVSEKNQEATRIKCQQLAKQIKDFEMVLSRNAADRRANDKPVQPIKINRSVGLQVNFLTDHGVQSLRQLQQQNTAQKSSSAINGTNSNFYESSGNTTNPRRGLKVRAPRTTEASTPITTKVPTTAIQVPPLAQISTATPAALVVAKPLEASHSLASPAQCSNVQPILPKQSVLVNGKVPIPANRQPVQTLNTRKNNTNDLIDLTDDGTEKMKSAVGPGIITTTTFVHTQGTATSKAQAPRFQRVIQALPGNMSLATQPTSIRVVQPSSQPTPTALVNNMNAPRLAYVMQGAPGTRQLLIASSPNQIRPISSSGKSQYSAVTYKTGMSTIANGTVRVLTTPANSSFQLIKHPAPLPETPNQVTNPAWKLPPPAPSLKISKVAYGIVLSWNMTLTDKHADIASFQLYAYQEVAGVPPSTSLWKKVGDVRAMPLPMACTLSQFSEGNNYHFAVRGVDTHSRLGQYSPPGNISL